MLETHRAVSTPARAMLLLNRVPAVLTALVPPGLERQESHRRHDEGDGRSDRAGRRVRQAAPAAAGGGGGGGLEVLERVLGRVDGVDDVAAAGGTARSKSAVCV